MDLAWSLRSRMTLVSQKNRKAENAVPTDLLAPGLAPQSLLLSAECGPSAPRQPGCWAPRRACLSEVSALFKLFLLGSLTQTLLGHSETASSSPPFLHPPALLDACHPLDCPASEAPPCVFETYSPLMSLGSDWTIPAASFWANLHSL